MYQNIGFLLLVGGFLGTAFTASLDATEMPWAWYLHPFVVGAIGVYILKDAAKRGAQAAHVLENNRAALKQSLNNVIANLDALKAKKDELPAHEARFEIDRLFRADLMAFADARTSMIHIYSMQDYADVMSHFAAGERYINRIWSASADGYVDEVKAYLDRAHDQFLEAKARLEAAPEGASA